MTLNNSKNIRVYPCNTPVVIILGTVAGIITCVVIRYDSVTYEVTYCDQNIYHNEWVTEDQIIAGQKKKIVGFKNGE